ncbi:trihelix transcription factor GT-2-like [Humulus lupulus]|uniref:trihelix transcription factor GT-2-like n=1 Tax=Humulus lupulus TaxID=3486 RepID=UPI002B40EF75|nr:trihelix transcription factor GT-2-like [Humulus lupulus]
MGDASAEAAVAAASVAAVAAQDHVVLRHEEGRGGGDGEGRIVEGNLSNNSAEEDNKLGGENVDDGGGGDRSGGNRWPRQETLALLKIRQDMDATFRDSSLKGPLWEEVSRKLAALGFQRSAKKCKEKFENVYKYHKRTKEGRTGKTDGKTYRFFDQLAAFEQNHHPPPLQPPPPPSKPQIIVNSPTTPWTTPPPITTTTPTTTVVTTTYHINNNLQNPTNNIPPSPLVVPLPPTPTPTPTNNTNNNPTLNISSNNSLFPPQTKSINHLNTTTTIPNLSSSSFPTAAAGTTNNHHDHHLFSSSSTSSSTASDEEFQARSGQKRKRKWRDFFRKLTKEVIRKQEEMQKKFLETVEKSEQARIVREDAWRLQEMARVNREHEILVQERSTAAAKDAAVIAFLQKVSGGSAVVAPQNNSSHLFLTNHENSNFHDHLHVPVSLPPLPPQPVVATPPPRPKLGDNGLSYSANAATSPVQLSPSRWPKSEVQALINLRRTLELKYHENGPKGPLWEEISTGMRRLGYNRSSKRCKEKWENINKYFKKVKDSNKKRPEDSKTCPYFHQLDALYREKTTIKNNVVQNNNGISEKTHFGMEPLMVQPERQWPESSDHEEEEDGEELHEEDEILDEERDSSSTELEEDHHNHHVHNNNNHNNDRDRLHQQGGTGSYLVVDNKQSSSVDVVE